MLSSVSTVLTDRLQVTILVCNQLPRPTQPFTFSGMEMSNDKNVAMLYIWEVKAVTAHSICRQICGYQVDALLTIREDL